MPATATHLEGVIRAGEAYPLKEFRRRSCWGAAALRTARRNGLPIRYVGRSAFVLGDDVLAYLAKQPTSRGK